MSHEAARARALRAWRAGAPSVALPAPRAREVAVAEGRSGFQDLLGRASDALRSMGLAKGKRQRVRHWNRERRAITRRALTEMRAILDEWLAALDEVEAEERHGTDGADRAGAACGHDHGDGHA